jgi:Fe-S-cluster containining protein
MSDRCTGHCCKRFTLPYSPEELVAYKDRLLESDVVVPMVTFLEVSTLHADGIDYPDAPRWWYTCKNLLPDGNCGIYETRPRMCWDYPYESTCQYVDCTWEAGKQEQPKQFFTLKTDRCKRP